MVTEGQIREYMQRTGLPYGQSAFILSMEAGEIRGDTIALDDNGNEVAVPEPLITEERATKDWVQQQMERIQKAQLAQDEKGGEGSGHYGHAGRPGQVGGSLPGSVAVSIRTGRTAEERQAAAHVQNTLGKIKAGLMYRDPETGLHTVDREWSQIDDDKWYIRLQIEDDEGQYAGQVERTYNVKENYVYHNYFRVEGSHQGQGFGSRLYESMEKGYIKAGVDSVHMYANINVGGYAWARMGYDFMQDNVRKAYADELGKEWYRRYGGNEMQIRTSFLNLRAWEMAAMTGPDGYRIGKEFMLGKHWNAIKELGPGSPHRRAASAYYRAKADKKKGKK